MLFLDRTYTDDEIVLCGISRNNPRNSVLNDKCSLVVSVFCHFVGSFTMEGALYCIPTW
jgi:hypothetical protein